MVEILPSRIFECAEQTTNVQKNTLNPAFDECFELYDTFKLIKHTIFPDKNSNKIQILSPASAAQCWDPHAMVRFSVFDHDVLSFNDFAGECFLSLNGVPGLPPVDAATGESDEEQQQQRAAGAFSHPGNFHGLKQVSSPGMVCLATKLIQICDESRSTCRWRSKSTKVRKLNCTKSNCSLAG